MITHVWKPLSPSIRADGLLSVDGLPIYKMENFELALVPAADKRDHDHDAIDDTQTVDPNDYRHLYPFRPITWTATDCAITSWTREGDPVVMVHGNPTWSFFFRRMMITAFAGVSCHRPGSHGMRPVGQTR
jgi:hypothetical protein